MAKDYLKKAFDVKQNEILNLFKKKSLSGGILLQIDKPITHDELKSGNEQLIEMGKKMGSNISPKSTLLIDEYSGLSDKEKKAIATNKIKRNDLLKKWWYIARKKAFEDTIKALGSNTSYASAAVWNPTLIIDVNSKNAFTNGSSRALVEMRKVIPKPPPPPEPKTFWDKLKEGFGIFLSGIAAPFRLASTILGPEFGFGIAELADIVGVPTLAETVEINPLFTLGAGLLGY